MKTAVSIPDDLFRQADDLAKRLGKSRSELYADALEAHIHRNGDDDTTRRLDLVYADEPLDEGERDWLDTYRSNVQRRNPW